jgi:hypothetical protein
LQEFVKSQIKQNSDEIAAMTQKYDGQLAHLKNQTEESARAITLDVIQRLTVTESKLNKLYENLDNRISIVGRLIGATRSASSIYNDDNGVMHGELY